eukprot:CAMPEP_0117526238 /NCGR_PEP_ID=MMETSP0784-20121206/36182_1 /TAXON_ID=39447 /ORGANISM="" /LENGTH=278 /DNA_ID=CAMNT_0005322459 /DNA_START=66 /DNA_END=902 /DNA_ORIENTATION=-
MSDAGDSREVELEMLQAMYSQEGELAVDATDRFSFTLRLEVEALILDLSMSLPTGYPTVPPNFRIMCDNISRSGIDELTEGLSMHLQSCAGESCVTGAAEWLVENAPKHVVVPEEATTVETKNAKLSPCKEGLWGARCVLHEERGDLFEVSTEWALCHCVSKDLEMSAGIAVEFKKQFGGVPELRSQKVDVGGVGILQKKGRYIYYLVTKNKKGGKPTMTTLEASLRAMRKHMLSNGVKKLAMPHIGCGLDHLSWGAVAELLVTIFDEDEVELLAKQL